MQRLLHYVWCHWRIQDLGYGATWRARERVYKGVRTQGAVPPAGSSSRAPGQEVSPGQSLAPEAGSILAMESAKLADVTVGLTLSIFTRSVPPEKGGARGKLPKL